MYTWFHFLDKMFMDLKYFLFLLLFTSLSWACSSWLLLCRHNRVSCSSLGLMMSYYYSDLFSDRSIRFWMKNSCFSWVFLGWSMGMRRNVVLSNCLGLQVTCFYMVAWCCPLVDNTTMRGQHIHADLCVWCVLARLSMLAWFGSPCGWACLRKDLPLF
jgi:hypothetical protein